MLVKNTLPTQQRLKELFDYDEHTGELINKKTGNVVGANSNPRDYYYVRIGVSAFTAQRVIWKWMTGEEPGEVIDHKNEDKLDNRFCNLQSITHAENTRRSTLGKPSPLIGKPSPQKLSTTDIKLIHILYQMGHTGKQIANIIGDVSFQAVYYHLKRATN